MSKLARYLQLLCCLLGVGILSPALNAVADDTGWRLSGTLNLRSYAYQDAAGTRHQWFMPTADAAIYRLGTPLTIHLSGGYIGDNADEFSHSGQGRLLSAYLQYCGARTNASVRLGRFFLYRGLALGVLDGAEISRRWNRGWEFSAFGGTLGPIARDFALTNIKDSPAFGGQLRFTPLHFPWVRSAAFTLGYARWSRDDLVLRDRVGVESFIRVNDRAIWINSLQSRRSGDALRRFVTRLRWNSSGWTAMVEAAMISPDVPDGGWFNGFGLEQYSRFRFDATRYLHGHRWGAGLDGAVTLSGSKSGVRSGPRVITPYGQAGYRLSIGDHARIAGPWADVQYAVIPTLELHVSAARTTYEWEDMDIATDHLTMAVAGLRFSPSSTPHATLSAEYQIYQTPDMKQDRRAQAALTWRFDTAPSRRGGQ